MFVFVSRETIYRIGAYPDLVELEYMFHVKQFAISLFMCFIKYLFELLFVKCTI